MDAPALATWLALGVAASVAGIQLYVGRRQSEAALISAKATLMSAGSAGHHTIAEFRQRWIDRVIETLCEHHSIVMSRPAGTALSADETRILSASRTKLEILLNPGEPDTVAVLAKIDQLMESRTPEQRAEESAEMLKVARRLLKREWERIKDELEAE